MSSQANPVQPVTPAPANPPSPSDALILRPVTPDDGPAVHAVLTTCLDDVLTDQARWLERWRWQYWDNPFRQERPAGWVLTAGRQIVGHLGAVYVPLRIGHEQKTAVIGADYAVTPEALASGNMFAGLQLAQAFFDAAEGLVPMATTANDKTAAVFGRFGCQPAAWTREFFRTPANLAQEIRTCRGSNSRLLRRLLHSSLGGIISPALTQAYRLARRRPGIPLPADAILEVTTPRLARDLETLNDLCHRSRSEKGRQAITVDRTGVYLDWRYGRHPERDRLRAVMLRRTDGSALGGIVVFLAERGTQRRMYVQDLVAPPLRPDVVRGLFCAALRLTCDQGAEFLVTMPGRCDLRSLFWELGFESRSRSAPAATVKLPDASPLPAEQLLQEGLELWHGAMF